MIKKQICAIVLLFMISPARGQKMQTVSGHCGIYFKSMEDLVRQKGKELDFYDFKTRQTVASIGAQCCHWEAAYAAGTDSVMFYLEDIDTSSFTTEQTAFAWHYYDSLRGKPMTSGFKRVVGNEKATLLPENAFNKIIIINSFHEFTFQAEMLADLKMELKPALPSGRPGGILYIDEALPKKEGQLHSICKKPLLTDEEMLTLLAKKGFEYINGLDFNFRKKRPVRKIFAFRKKM